MDSMGLVIIRSTTSVAMLCGVFVVVFLAGDDSLSWIAISL